MMENINKETTTTHSTLHTPLSKKDRIWILDFLRGLCVLLMIFDHVVSNFIMFLPNLANQADKLTSIVIDLFYWGRYYWVHPARVVIRALVVFTFYFVCGICCSLSRSNLKRGLELVGVSLLITIVTYGIDYFMFSGMPNTVIWFGTLHCLAIAILLVALIELIPKEKLKLWIYLIGGVLMFIPHIYTYTVSPASPTAFNMILGIYPLDGNVFYSADIAPLLPNIGIVFIGTALGKVIIGRKWLKPSKTPAMLHPVNFVGRNALLIYVLHQPIVLAIMYLLVLIF